MANFTFADNVILTLSASMDNATTTMQVTSGTGCPSTGQVIGLIGIDSALNPSEQVLITSGGGTTTMTVTRGYGGTTAGPHVGGANVYLGVFATALNAMAQGTAAPGGVGQAPLTDSYGLLPANFLEYDPTEAYTFDTLIAGTSTQVSNANRVRKQLNDLSVAAGVPSPTWHTMPTALTAGVGVGAATPVGGALSLVAGSNVTMSQVGSQITVGFGNPGSTNTSLLESDIFPDGIVTGGAVTGTSGLTITLSAPTGYIGGARAVSVGVTLTVASTSGTYYIDWNGTSGVGGFTTTSQTNTPAAGWLRIAQFVVAAGAVSGTTDWRNLLPLYVSPTATPNSALVDIGPGPWNGLSAGHFVGVAAGTALGVNLASGSTSNLLDLQIAGVSKLSLTSAGLLTTGSLVTSGNATIGGTLTFGGGFNSSATTQTLSGVPAANANSAVLAIGSAPFDGSSAGHYVGSASGSLLALNAASGFAGYLANWEVAGVSKFLLDASGNLTVAGNISYGGSFLTTAAQNTFSATPTATANYGVLSLGHNPFDGVTAGFFAGVAAGTELAINTASGFTGRFADWQAGGVSKFSVDSSGNVVAAGTLAVTGTTTSTGNLSTAANLAVTGTTALTGATTVQGNLTAQGNANLLSNTPAVSANTGLLSLGSAPFDGVTAGFYVGSAQGTAIAGNLVAGYTGHLLNLQVAGVQKLMADASGNVTAAGGLTAAGSLAITGNSAITGNETVAGTFGVTAAATLSSTLAVTGNATVGGTLVSTGNITGNGAQNTLSGVPVATANAGLLSLGGGAWDGVTAGFFAGSALGTQAAVNAVTGFAGNLVDLQVGGVSKVSVTAAGDTATVGRLSVSKVTPATANYGLVSLGSGAFDGVSAGHFVGNAVGTKIAVNATSGYTGNLEDLQTAGSSMWSVSAAGVATLAGSLHANATGTNGSISTGTGGNIYTGTGGNIYTGSSGNIYTGSGGYITTAAGGPIFTGSGGAIYTTGAGSIYTGLGGNLSTNGLLTGYTSAGALPLVPPSQLTTAVVASTGNLGVGTYQHAATFYSVANGETAMGPASPAITTNAGNLRASIAGIPLGPAGVTQRSLYRTKVNGTAFYFWGTIADNVSTTLVQTTVSSTSAAGQKVLNVTSTTGWAAGMAVVIGNTFTALENNVVSSTGAGVLNLTNNLANTYAAAVNLSNYANPATNSGTLNVDNLADANLGTQTAPMWVLGGGGVTSALPASIHSAVTPGTTNHGHMSIGGAPWDGATTGHFAGSASGTIYAANAISGYGGNLLDLQVAGVSKAKIDATGNLTVTGLLTAAGTTFTSGTITLADGDNIAVGSTTGTQIATATTQKLGFFGKTPIVQLANTTDLRTGLINLGFLASGGANPLNLNGGALTTGTNLTVGQATGTVTSTVQGFAAQTADLAQWTTSTPTVVGGITIAGQQYSGSPIASVGGAAVPAEATTNAVPPSTAYGLISAGSAPWDNTTSGFFAGSASGTLYAGNTVSSYAGNMLDLQKAGVSKFSVSNAGNTSIAGTLGVTGASTLAAVAATTGTFSSTLGVTGASTLAALSATTGTFSSTLGVTGASTLAGMTATTGSFSSTLGVTGATTLTTATLAPAATAVGLTTNGAASQTGELSLYQNSVGTVLARINARGMISAFGTHLSPTTQAVPATPTFTSSSGTGGTIAAGTYLYYDVYTRTSDGLSTGASASVSSGALSGSTSQVTIGLTAAPAGFTHDIYRTTAGGSVPYFYTNIAGASTSFNDTGAATLSTLRPSIHASYGALSVGTGPLDGTTSGFFTGSASGTQIAVNAPAGFAGNLLDIQLAGAIRLSVAANGNITTTGGIVANSANGVASAAFVAANQAGAFLGIANNAGAIITNRTTTTNVALTIKGMAAQTGNLQEWASSTPTTGLVVDSSARLRAPGITAPTIAVGAAAGTGPPTPTVTGSDQVGTVAWGTGTATTTGALLTVTWGGGVLANAPHVVITANNAASAPLVSQLYVTKTTGGFTINTTAAETISQGAGTYSFDYFCLAN